MTYTLLLKVYIGEIMKFKFKKTDIGLSKKRDTKKK